MSNFVDENKRPLFLVMYFTSFTPYFSIYNIAFLPRKFTGELSYVYNNVRAYINI